MTLATLAAFAPIPGWDWTHDVRGILIGVAAAGLANLWSWGRRMSRLDQKLTNLGADLKVLTGELNVRIREAESATGEKIATLRTQVEILPSKIDAAKDTTESLRRELLASIDNLTKESGRVFKELSEHFKDCGEHVIGPLKKRLNRVAEKIGIPA